MVINNLYIISFVRIFIYDTIVKNIGLLRKILVSSFFVFIKFIMNYTDLNEKLKQLKNEDFIWLLYIGIIFLSWFANGLERKYFIYNDLKSKESYRAIMVLIFCILIIVYLYFLKDSYQDIKQLNINDSDNKKNLTYLSFVGSLLIFISGIIFLYIAYKDEDIDVELAFN